MSDFIHLVLCLQDLSTLLYSVIAIDTTECTHSTLGHLEDFQFGTNMNIATKIMLVHDFWFGKD